MMWEDETQAIGGGLEEDDSLSDLPGRSRRLGPHGTILIDESGRPLPEFLPPQFIPPTRGPRLGPCGTVLVGSDGQEFKDGVTFMT